MTVAIYNINANVYKTIGGDMRETVIKCNMCRESEESSERFYGLSEIDEGGFSETVLCDARDSDTHICYDCLSDLHNLFIREFGKFGTK